MSTAKSRKRGRGKTIDSWKSKEWYDVYAPKIFKEEQLGSIPSSDPESVVGRKVEFLLYDLTKNFKHTTTKLQFKVAETNGQRANTIFWGHELTRDYIRSLIKRGTTRIDGIFNFTTVDGVVFRVSTFIVTHRRAKQSQQHTIRKIIFQVLDQFAKNLTHEKFIQGIIYGKFATNIEKLAKTIYPLRACQIRKVKVIYVPPDLKETGVVEEEEVIDDVALEMKEHGKTIKAKKAKKRHDQSEGDSEANATNDDSADTNADETSDEES